MPKKINFMAFMLAMFSIGPTSAFPQDAPPSHDIRQVGNLTNSLGALRDVLNANTDPTALGVWIDRLERTTQTLEQITPHVDRFNDAVTLGQYSRTMEMLDTSVERSVARIEAEGKTPENIAYGVFDVLATSAQGTVQTSAGAFVSGFSVGKTSLFGRHAPQKVLDFFQSARTQSSKPFTHQELRARFDRLVRTQLLPRYQQLDPKLSYGYTGSFRTGVVGNPDKVERFGQAIDLSNYDIDFWIKSKLFHPNYGKGLHADIPFRELLAQTPGFKGLRIGQDGFSIKFLSPPN